MDYKPELKKRRTPRSPGMAILITAINMVLFGALLGGVLLVGLAKMYHIPIEEIQTYLTPDSTVADRNFLRLVLLIQHLTLFIIPALVTGYIVGRKYFASYLHLDKIPKGQNVILGIGIFLVSFPLIQYSYSINKLIPLPDWAMTMEDTTAELINNLLVTTGPMELIFNVFLIGIIPGLGEELIFRGLIQNNIAKWIKNPIVAIWITAVIFSAFHFQFQGFIPRLLLGALLGYLFYWTNNLWVPIIAHAFNNGIQVIMQYLYSEDISKVNIDDMESVPAWVALISIVLIYYLSTLIIKKTETDFP